jgi:hypothetical protein
MSSTLGEQSATAMDLLRIDAFGPNGAYRTRNRELVTSTAGVPVAELSIAPPLYVSRAISAQRSTRPLPSAQREAALVNAADAFATGVIAGLDFKVARCGRGGGKCSPFSPLETAQVFTRCGPKRSRWDIEWRCARRVASPSPRTGWSTPCKKRDFAPKTRYIYPPIIAEPARSSGQPISQWCTGITTLSINTSTIRQCSSTGPGARRS